MNEIVKSIKFVANFIINGFIILLVVSIFIDSPLSSVGFVLLMIFGALIITAIGAAIWIKVKTWILFDWLNW